MIGSRSCSAVHAAYVSRVSDTHAAVVSGARSAIRRAPWAARWSSTVRVLAALSDATNQSAPGRAGSRSTVTTGRPSASKRARLGSLALGSTTIPPSTGRSRRSATCRSGGGGRSAGSRGGGAAGAAAGGGEGEEERVLARGGRRGGRAGEADVEVEAERLVAMGVGADHRQDEGEDAGAARAQASRGRVRAVADPLGRVDHARTRPRIDPALAVERVRDRRQRDARDRRDIAHGRTFAGGHRAAA